MKSKQRTLMIVLLVSVALMLTACSSPEEKAAKLQLKEAVTLEQQKDLPAARALLAELVQKYPKTDAAGEALVLQQRIIEQMSGIERELRKTLESLVLVIAGYQSMTGRQLTKLSDLDSDDYMFDTAYMAEAVPAEVEAFVLLDGKGGFQLWVYRSESRMGMQRASNQRNAQPFAGETIVTRLRSGYATEPLAANLTALTPTVTAEK